MKYDSKNKSMDYSPKELQHVHGIKVNAPKHKALKSKMSDIESRQPDKMYSDRAMKRFSKHLKRNK